MRTYHVWAEHVAGQSVGHPCKTGVYSDPTDFWSTQVEAESEDDAVEEGRKQLAAHVAEYETCDCRRHAKPGSDAWWGSVSIIASWEPFPEYVGDDSN